MGFFFGADTSSLSSPVSITRTFPGAVSGTEYPGFSAFLTNYNSSYQSNSLLVGHQVTLNVDSTSPQYPKGGMIGIRTQIGCSKVTGGQNTGDLIGVQALALQNGGKSVTIVGVDTRAGNTGPNGNGGSTDVAGFRAQIVQQTGSTGVGGAYGFWCLSPSPISGAITNLYGLKIEDQSGASANYAIKTGVGLVEFQDQVTAQSTLIVGSRLTNQGASNWHRTTFSNASVGLQASDHLVAQVGTMTAPRTFALTAANGFPGGHEITVMDESGSVGAMNTLTLTAFAADLINGLASLVLNSAYAKVTLISDGVSRWTIRS